MPNASFPFVCARCAHEWMRLLTRISHEASLDSLVDGMRCCRSTPTQRKTSDFYSKRIFSRQMWKEYRIFRLHVVGTEDIRVCMRTNEASVRANAYAVLHTIAINLIWFHQVAVKARRQRTIIVKSSFFVSFFFYKLQMRVKHSTVKFTSWKLPGGWDGPWGNFGFIIGIWVSARFMGLKVNFELTLLVEDWH